MNAAWNTKKRGTLRFLVIREGNEYCGVCLELNLIEYGDDPEKLMNSLKEGAESVIQAVREKKLSENLLNEPADLKFWLMYDSISKPTHTPQDSILYSILAKPYGNSPITTKKS